MVEVPDSVDGPTPARRSSPVARLYRWVFGVDYERNVGGPERALRLLVGLVALVGAGRLLAAPALPGLENAFLTLLVAVTGFFLVYEAQSQYCPLNHLLGRSTHREP